MVVFIVMKVGGVRVFEILMVLFVVVGIFNMFFVSVMECLCEFGIMVVIGWSFVWFFWLVMFESLLFGVVGLGVVLFFMVLFYYYLVCNGFDLMGLIFEE